MYYRVRGKAVIEHDCDCPYCHRDHQAKRDVNKVIEARCEEEAAEKALHTMNYDWFEEADWQKGTEADVSPLPDDQWMAAAGYAALPQLESYMEKAGRIIR